MSYFKHQKKYMDCFEKCSKKKSRKYCLRECEDLIHCLICAESKRRKR